MTGEVHDLGMGDPSTDCLYLASDSTACTSHVWQPQSSQGDVAQLPSIRASGHRWPEITLQREFPLLWPGGHALTNLWDDTQLAAITTGIDVSRVQYIALSSGFFFSTAAGTKETLIKTLPCFRSLRCLIITDLVVNGEKRSRSEELFRLGFKPPFVRRGRWELHDIDDEICTWLCPLYGWEHRKHTLAGDFLWQIQERGSEWMVPVVRLGRMVRGKQGFELI